MFQLWKLHMFLATMAYSRVVVLFNSAGVNGQFLFRSRCFHFMCRCRWPFRTSYIILCESHQYIIHPDDHPSISYSIMQQRWDGFEDLHTTRKVKKMMEVVGKAHIHFVPLNFKSRTALNFGDLWQLWRYWTKIATLNWIKCCMNGKTYIR